MTIKKIFTLFFFLSIPSSAAFAQKITAQQVLENVKKNFDAVKDYTVNLTGTVDMERLKVPQMKLTLYFKQPNKFKTESKGTTLIPRNILDVNPGELLSKFDGIVAGIDTIDGRLQYKLRLVSKPEKGRQVRESYVWVDGSRWTITRLDVFPMEGRKIEILIESTLIDGKYLLPSRILAKFDFEQNPDTLIERRLSPNRMPRKGSAELIYTDYRVNTGLTDEFFEQKKIGEQ